MSFPYGPHPGAAPMPNQPLVVIGDIQCTQTHVITPTGTFSIKGSTWYVNDMTHTTEEIPQWAIICAIVGALVICLFSLFFLLAKERKTTGYLQVTVNGEGFAYTTNVPVYQAAMAMDVQNRVNYARQLSAAWY